MLSQMTFTSSLLIVYSLNCLRNVRLAAQRRIYSLLNDKFAFTFLIQDLDFFPLRNLILNTYVTTWNNDTAKRRYKMVYICK